MYITYLAAHFITFFVSQSINTEYEYGDASLIYKLST